MLNKYIIRNIRFLLFVGGLIFLTFYASACSQQKSTSGNDVSIVGGIAADSMSPQPSVLEESVQSSVPDVLSLYKTPIQLDGSDSMIAAILSLSNKVDVFSSTRLDALDAESRKIATSERDYLLFNAFDAGDNVIQIDGTSSSDDINFDLTTLSYHLPSRKISITEAKQIGMFESILTIARIQNAMPYDEATLKKITDRANRVCEGTFAANFGDMVSFVYMDGDDWQVFYRYGNEESRASDNKLIERYLVKIQNDKVVYAEHKRITASEFLSDSHSRAYTTPKPIISISDLRKDAFWREDAYELIQDFYDEDAGISDVSLSRFDGDDEIIVKVSLDNGDSYRVYYSLSRRIPSTVRYSRMMPSEAIGNSEKTSEPSLNYGTELRSPTPEPSTEIENKNTTENNDTGSVESEPDESNEETFEISQTNTPDVTNTAD